MKQYLQKAERRAGATFLFTLYFVSWSMGQTPDWAWAKSASGSDGDIVYGIAVDPSGDNISCGIFQSDTITFDGNHYLNNSAVLNGSDIFIVKHDPAGNLLWARTFGSHGDDMLFDVATDDAGCIVITGGFVSHEIVFGNDTLINSSPNYTALFLVKLDANGNPMWARKSSGGECKGFEVDCEGDNIYLAGEFRTPAITLGGVLLYNSSYPAAANDIFYAKYNSAGAIIWGKSAWGFNDEKIGGMVAVPSGLYLTGFYSSLFMVFDSDTLVNHLPGHNDVFTVRLDTSGSVHWVRKAGTNSDEYGFSVTGISSGVEGVCVGGLFTDSINFGSVTLTNNPGMFLVRYDSAGNFLWARDAGSGSSANALVSDASGAIYAGGYFTYASITFGSTMLWNSGTAGGDILVVKYDSSGNPLWAKSADGNDGEGINALGAGNAGELYAGGIFRSASLDFGIPSLQNSGPAGTTWDIFIARLSPPFTHVEETALDFAELFPNPTSDRVRVVYNDALHGEIGIEFTDAFGKKILVQKSKGISDPFMIDVTGFAPGTYFCKIICGEKREVKKLIVLSPK